MPENQKKQDVTLPEGFVPFSPEAPAKMPEAKQVFSNNRDNADRSQRRNTRPGGNRSGGRFGAAKAKPEFDQKIIDIRRVTRVVAGGRRFSFSVVIVAGDRKGSVGVGIGKAGDTALAIDKAMKNAKKNMLKVVTTKTMSIPYEVSAKFASSRVTITPAPGRGIVAGSSIRSIIELAGLKDVGAKLRSGSKNRLNNARVAIEALKQLTPHRLAKKVKVAEVK